MTDYFVTDHFAHVIFITIIIVIIIIVIIFIIVVIFIIIIIVIIIIIICINCFTRVLPCVVYLCRVVRHSRNTQRLSGDLQVGILRSLHRAVGDGHVTPVSIHPHSRLDILTVKKRHHF